MKPFSFQGGVVHDPEHSSINEGGRYDAMNEWVCKEIGQKLMFVYPGHPWSVIAQVESGIAKIFLEGFSQWVVVIKISTLKSDPGLKSVVKYAGELLERLKLPRAGFDMGAFREALHRHPHHFNRNARAPE